MTSGNELRATIEQALPSLRSMDPAAAARRPREGAWSPKEELGHLVDSASNNHQRFVRALFVDDLVFPGYDQDEWVAAQGYAEAPLDELVELWGTFNRQIARVMDRTPADRADLPRVRHNLHQIAWEPVPAGEPATLRYFMRDYVGHLGYHLERILAAGRQG